MKEENFVIRNIMAILMDAVVVLLAMKFFIYILPMNLSVIGVYFFVIAVGSMHTARETFLRSRGRVLPVWWTGSIGLGVGLGTWAIMTHPGASVLHIPFIVMVSLITTILAHNIVIRIAPKLR